MTPKNAAPRTRETTLKRSKSGDVSVLAEHEVGTDDESGVDAIRRRAFEIYESRNGNQGDALADWIQAEAELSRKKL